jgi:hypothetical protein
MALPKDTAGAAAKNNVTVPALRPDGCDTIATFRFANAVLNAPEGRAEVIRTVPYECPVTFHAGFLRTHATSRYPYA